MELDRNVLIEACNDDVRHGRIIIPEGITHISNYSFTHCDMLKHIVIPDYVKHIGEGAFAYCENLESITIGNDVTCIERFTFVDCISLKRITIPKNVTIIEKYAFEDSGLKSAVGAYKAFGLTPSGKLKCRDKIYKEDQISRVRGELEMCWNGIHYCTNLFEVFNYYGGKIDKDITIYEIEPGKNILRKKDSSKCCTDSCRLVKRLYREDIIRILNEGENKLLKEAKNE